MKQEDEVVKDDSNVSALVTTSSKQMNVDSNLNGLTIFSEEEILKAENFLKRIIATDKGGIKTVNEGLAIMMRAKDLDLPFSNCIEHIHIINGRTGVDVHIIKTLLLRAGVTWKCTKDYTPLYEYTDSINIYCEDKLPEYCIKCRNKTEAEAKTNDDSDSVGVYPVKYYSDFSGNIYKDYQLNGKFAIAINQVQAKQIADSGKIPVYRIAAQPIDYVTEYEFTRYRMINGKEVITTATSRFSYSEALQADMFTKDTYKKYPRVMIGIRAFTYGARDIASDALMGCCETSELKLINNMPLSDKDVVDIDTIEV